MAPNITIRATRRGRRHALPETGGERVLCGRAASGVIVDDAMPDCRACLAAIARLTAGRS